jgi:minor extracellular serine protease Vpr
MGTRTKRSIVILCTSLVILVTNLLSQETFLDPRTIPSHRMLELSVERTRDVVPSNPLFVEPWIKKLDAGSRFAMFAYKNRDNFELHKEMFRMPDLPLGMQTTESGIPTVDIFIQFDTPGSVSVLKKYYVTPLLHTKDIIAARVPVTLLEDLAGEPSVRSIEMGYKRPAFNHISKVDIRADLVHQGFQLPRAYQGEGVIVGVIDTGIDFTHPDFSDDGGTRIQYLLEFTREGGQNEWTKTVLDANPTSVTQRDGDGGGGHGTHVTGSAAGGGRISSDMKGLAPKSDIIFIKGIRDQDSQGGFADVDVVNGVQYIFEKAQILGKPAVVNLSLGGMLGPLDGTSLYEQALSSLTGAGKIIVTACGNSGFDYIHAGGQSVPGVPSLSLLIPDNPEVSLSQIWYEQGAISQIAIGAFIQDLEGEWHYNETPIVPVGQSLGLENEDAFEPYPLNVNGQTVGYVAIDAVTTEHPLNGDGNIFLLILNNNDQNINISSALWTIMTVGTTQSRLDAWVVSGGEFFNQPMGFQGFNELPGDANHTVGSPSTALKVVSVGSYVTNNTWIDIDNNQRTWPNPHPNREPGQTIVSEIGQRSYFSSAGPTRDGRIAPDISAPGELIFSPMSSQLTDGIGYIRPLVLQGGNYLAMEGTSMASPHVTGLVALMLQIDPTLTYEQVVTLLQGSARSDSFTGAVPNNNFGAGKIDVYAVIKEMAGEGPGPGETIVLKHFNPDERQYVYTLDSEVPIDSGFVFGTNRYGDKSKATSFTLLDGMTQASLTEVKVWYGYKGAGVTNQSYTLEVFDGTAESGPVGNPLYSRSYALSEINADDNFQTEESATLYSIDPHVVVGPSFLISVNFGTYSATDFGNAAIVSTNLKGMRVSEVWEQWSNNEWHNLSDAWFGDDGQPNTGTNGAHLWIEATVNATVSAVSKKKEQPTSFSLAQNFPNPFNASTTIQFSVPEQTRVLLVVYDILGREVARLVDEEMIPGVYSVPFESRNISSGVYFYRIRTDSQESVRRMVLLR